MARRKKEPEGFHRDQIAQTAKALFACKGVESTTMDQIAKEAGYSKATLYVYFQNKEEIVAVLCKDSLQLLYDRICQAIPTGQDAKKSYRAICHALMEYQATYPEYFEIALGEIRLDSEQKKTRGLQEETFEIGEQINLKIKEILEQGAKEGTFRQGISSTEHIFLMWACLSSVIIMSVKKQNYLASLGTSKEQFCEDGFTLLFRAIEGGKANE